MSITIHPLPGHPFLVQVQEATRSPQELLDNSRQRSNTKDAGVLLTLPPVVLIQEGGGEQLLNRDVVAAQLSYRKVGKKAPAKPASLRVWLIDPKLYDGETLLLFAFLFGSIQRMYYQRNHGETASWKSAMQCIEKDPHLKAVIQNQLFEGEALAPRHYRVLLGAAQVGESSINQELKKIRDACSKNEEVIESQSPQPDPSVMVNEASVDHCESSNSELPSDTVADETIGADNEFDMAAALGKISQAAQRGDEQFTHGIALEGN